jgi:hypothetical protein
MRSIIIAFAALAMAAVGLAYPAYNNDFPNGNTTPPSPILLGHPGGNTRAFTKVAVLYRGQGYKWTQTVCQTDSDGDGQSNGLEMGDPCCVWTVGEIPALTTGLSDPNDPNSKTTNVMPTCA